MPKASRTKLRQHAPAAQLPSKRSFAVDEAREVVLPGSGMNEQTTGNLFDQAAPGPSRKKGLVIPASAIPPPLASHPYSRSHTRREKRKQKQNLHGGTLDAVAEALIQAVGGASEGEEEEPKRKSRKGEKEESAKEKRKDADGEGLIGEGKGRTMREKARRKQIKIEGTRIPAILKHPEYKKNPWATIRLHASNTLESGPVVGKTAQGRPVGAGAGDGMVGIDQYSKGTASGLPGYGQGRASDISNAEDRARGRTLGNMGDSPPPTVSPALRYLRSSQSGPSAPDPSGQQPNVALTSAPHPVSAGPNKAGFGFQHLSSPLTTVLFDSSISATDRSPPSPIAGRPPRRPPASSPELGQTLKMSADEVYDTSSIPKAFLESYPYPAFVLITPIPPSTTTEEEDDALVPPQDHRLPFTRTINSATSSFTPIWANEKWQNLTQGNPMLECVSIESARKLGDWISGAKAARHYNAMQSQVAPGGARGEPMSASMYAAQHGAGSSRSAPRNRELEERMTGLVSPNSLDPDDSFDLNEITPTLARTGAVAPAGFWEPEVPYEEHASTSGNSASDTGATGIEGVDANHPGPFTLTLDLIDPGQVTLEMTKTSLPIFKVGPSGARTMVSTDSFVIVTTVPKSAFVLNGGPALSRITTAQASHPEGQIPARRTDDNNDGFLTPSLNPLPSSQPTRPRTTILSNPPTSSGPLTLPLPDANPHGLNPQLTPTDEIMALDLADTGGDEQSTRPLYFSSDGTVSRPRGPMLSGVDDRGKPLDVHVLLAQTDWSKTGLGPREKWPQSLKTIVSLIMQYPHQCCLWWGKDLTLIYNAPYAETIHKHPDLFGMSGPVAWQEIWNSVGPLSELVLSGTPVSKEDDFLLFKQLPHQGTGTFEVYHSWMWVPIVQEDGTFGGLWNATINTTKKVLAERRMASVREMGERTSIARTMKEFDSAVVDILASNPKDMPFAALYHVDELTSTSTNKRLGGMANSNVKSLQSDSTYASTSTKTKCQLTLAGSIGVPENHRSAPSTLRLTLDLRSRDARAGIAHMTNSPTLSVISSLSGAQSRRATEPSPAPGGDDDMQGVPSASGLGGSAEMESWPFKEALQTRRIVLVEDCSALISGYPIRVWDELPNAAVVVPIANDSDEGVPSAVIVIGLSIRRPFDEDYESFLHVLRLQLASGIAAVRSYEAERQRIDELAALDRAKSMLFSNVSHELRTPLTLVSGPLDDLLQETKEGPKKEMLIMARRNVRRLTRLVSTLMDVSRLEAGRLKGSFRLVNLGLVTRDLAALFRGAIERAKLRYVVECDLSPRNAYVDPDHWEKIMFNLIGNAMKYTMSGFVHVTLSYGPGEAYLTVKDSGVGIPASDIDLIGDRFHRVQSISRSHEGTGIGISLIKELIKLHGGVLEIESLTALESADGSHGSIFRVRIPLGVDHLPRDAIDTSQSAPANNALNYAHGIVDEAMQWNRDREGSDLGSSSDSGKAPSAGESSSQSSRGLDPSTLYFKKEDVIMLVDDSFDTRRYMKSIFAPFCTVVEARDGLEALELCRKSLPHLVISDVMMPNLDGFGLLAAIREDPKLAMLPIVMLTARGGEEAKVEGLLAGADDHIEKPFNARELIARAHMQIQLGKRRRELEVAFEERTAELRTVTEYSPGGIFRCDGDGEVVYANSAWFEISGFLSNRPDMNTWFESITPLHRERVHELWSATFKSDQPTQAMEWQFNNGRWVMCKLIRLDKFAPGLRGVLGSLMDITERKMNEEIQRLRVVEAEQRRIEAEEAKHQQELLIDITSHEIRNPISSLMQCSSLVKTNLLSLQEQFDMSIKNSTPFTPTNQLLTTINEDLEALESIYQCGLAQERISNDVLSLGRIQLDMFQMFDVETDIVAEAQKVISIFQNEARMKRISLSYKIGESVERLGIHSIKTDPVRMGQVVTNLLSNGIRFTSTSNVRKIQLSYDISFDPPADGTCVMPGLPDPPAPGQLKDDMTAYLYVAVTDTGPGLTPKELDMLFQRFSQVSPKTHTIFGGSGLGLFVCRKITDLMGGRIEVVSQHGKGSTFRFFIQVRTCHTTKRSAPADSPGPGGKRSDGLKRPALKKRNTGPRIGGGIGPKPHVLIVEDNLINQTVLARQLRHVGLTCEVANNGLEALEKIRKVSSLVEPRVGKPFDCTLMDLEMPIMDGLTALRHIREEEAAGTLALNLIIALTGNARQGQIDEAKAAGMDEVVIKPYRLDDLLVKIEDMMKIRNAAPAQIPSSPIRPIREGVEAIAIEQEE